MYDRKRSKDISLAKATLFLTLLCLSELEVIPYFWGNFHSPVMLLDDPFALFSNLYSLTCNFRQEAPIRSWEKGHHLSLSAVQNWDH